MEPILMENDFVIPFDSIHPRYGRAEFTVCPVYRTIKKRRILVKVFISREQQETREQWEVLSNADNLSIQSYGADMPPKVWLTGWCGQHKTHFMRIYVPNDTNRLRVELLYSVHLTFEK